MNDERIARTYRLEGLANLIKEHLSKLNDEGTEIVISDCSSEQDDYSYMWITYSGDRFRIAITNMPTNEPPSVSAGSIQSSESRPSKWHYWNGGPVDGTHDLEAEVQAVLHNGVHRFDKLKNVIYTQLACYRFI